MQMDAGPVATVADDAVIVKAEPPNLIHDVLMTCGVMNAAHHATLIEMEGFDSIATFISISGDVNIS